MNKKPRVSFGLGQVALLATLLAGLFVCPGSATAQSQFFWDATNPINASPGSGGSGNWNTNAGNAVWWVSGGSDSAWTDGNIANFAGTAGIVTLNTPVTANGLTFATTGYTVGGTSNLTLSTATITLPDSGTETVNCPLAGNTTVTVSPTTSGPSTLILGGTNTYTGATTINSGTALAIGGAGSLNNGTYAGTITDNGAFIYNSSATQTLSGTISGAGTLTQEGTGKLTLTHANTTFTGGTTINSGSTLQLGAVSGAGSTTTITNNGILNLNAGGAANYPFTTTGGSSSIINLTMAYSVGSENLRFPGPGTLSGFGGTINLIALNSTGGTNGGTFGAGQLILSVNSTILTSPGTWNIYAGATLDIVAPATPSSANVIINGPGNSQPFGALRLDSCNQTGNVLLNGAGITIGQNSGPSQISGIISDGGNNYGFTKAGGNFPMIFSGANTYTGPTVLPVGTLQVDSTELPGVSGPLGKSAASNPGSIVLSGGTLQFSSANTNDYSGRFSTNTSQAYNIDVNGQGVTFATPLTSSGGALTLKDTAGGGTLTLSGTNTYTGITTINSGTLNISGSIKGSTAINVNGAANLELSSSNALSSGAILTLPSSPAGNSVNLNFSGTQTILALYFGATQQPAGTYSASSNNSSGAFTGTGILNVAPQIFWDGNGTDAGSQSSANGGGNGNWDNSTSNWWVSGSSDTKWSSNSIANFAGTAGTVSLNASEIANGITFATDGYTLSGSSTLTLAGTPTIALPNGGAATINCPIAGTGGLTESGSGTLTLGGSNTFTGATTIGDGGTLVLSSTNAFAGPTTIGSGSMLNITNAGVMAGGTYPGNIANAGALAYNSSASQTLSGIISGTGSLTQNGPGALTLSGLNTMNGPITISGGSLTLSGDLNNNPTFNTGNYSGAMQDDGAFIYRSSAQQTISSGISGTGTLTQSGSGMLTLSGQNSYTGTTTISSNSTLIISGSGILGGGDYETNIINNGTFTYGSASSQTIGGVISGSGVLILSGASTLTLSGANTYRGGTTINNASCTFDVNSTGSILGNVTVTAGTLELDSNTAMASTATLKVASSAVVNLTQTGTQNIDALYVGGIQQAPGVYGAGTNNPGGVFNGSGTLAISSGPPVTISSPTISTNHLTISWTSVAGGNYNVYTTTNLTPPVTWTIDNSSPIPSQGATTSYTLTGSIVGQPQLFVKVQQ